MTALIPKPQIPAWFGGSVQVLAVGLPLCATTTLKEIFEEQRLLDIGPTMHMDRCLSLPPNLRFIWEALREADTQKRRAILYKLFAGCAATTGFPGHLFIEDLVEMYSDAKIVLNVSEGGAAGWASSMKSAISPFLSWKYRITCFWSVPDYWHYLCEMEFDRLVKYRCDIANVWSAKLYEIHNQWVLDVCQRKGKEVLIWEPSMGWGPLCDFVGRKEPDVGIPKIDDRATMEMVVQRRVALGLRMWMKKIAVPLAFVILGGWGILRPRHARV